MVKCVNLTTLPAKAISHVAIPFPFIVQWNCRGEMKSV